MFAYAVFERCFGRRNVKERGLRPHRVWGWMFYARSLLLLLCFVAFLKGYDDMLIVLAYILPSVWADIKPCVEILETVKANEQSMNKSCPPVTDLEPLSSQAAVCTYVGGKLEILGQCFRIDDGVAEEGLVEQFVTVTHVCEAAVQGALYITNGRDVVRAIRYVVPLETIVPDFAIIEMKRSSSAALSIPCGSIGDVSRSDFVGSLHAHGIFSADTDSYWQKSSGCVKVYDDGLVYAYTGSANFGWSGAPLTKAGKLVGLHSLDLGPNKLNSGFLLAPLVPILASRARLQSPSLWAAILKGEEEFEVFETYLGNMELGYRVRDRFGKSFFLLDDEIPDAVGDELRSQSKRSRGVRTRAQSNIPAVRQTKEEVPNAVIDVLCGVVTVEEPQMVESLFVPLEQLVEKPIALEEEELLVFPQNRPASQVNFNNVRTSRACLSQYANAVNDLSDTIGVLQMTMSQFREDRTASLQLAADIHYLDMQLAAVGPVGRELTDIYTSQAELNPEEYQQKMTETRWRARQKDKPYPDAAVIEEAEGTRELLDRALAVARGLPPRQQPVVAAQQYLSRRMGDFIQKKYGMDVTAFEVPSFLLKEGPRGPLEQKVLRQEAKPLKFQTMSELGTVQSPTMSETSSMEEVVIKCQIEQEMGLPKALSTTSELRNGPEQIAGPSHLLNDKRYENRSKEILAPSKIVSKKSQKKNRAASRMADMAKEIMMLRDRSGGSNGDSPSSSPHTCLVN